MNRDDAPEAAVLCDHWQSAHPLNASFRVRLPLMGSPVELARKDGRAHVGRERVTTETPLPELGGTHVLAVDDEPDALTMMKELLEAAGARVTTVKSAEIALSLIPTMHPDVLVADIGMRRLA